MFRTPRVQSLRALATLTEDLSTRLQTDALLSGLLGDIAAPVTQLQGLTVPAEAGDTSAVAGISAPLDLGPLGAAIGRVSGSATALVQGLPAAGGVLTPLTSALELVEGVTAGDLAGGLRSLLERLSEELGQRDGDFLGTLEHLSGLLADAPELRTLLDLVTRIVRLSGVSLDVGQVVGNPLPAVLGTLRALGALMSLESVLAEGERLTAIMARQLDAERVGQELDALRGSFDVAAEHVDRAAGAAPVPGALDDAEQAILDCAARLAEVEAWLGRGMGFGEATLVHLDLAQLDADVERAVAVLRTVNADAIGAAVRRLLDGLRPALQLDLPGAAAASLDELLGLVESRVADIASAVATVPITPIVQPLSQGLGRVTGVLQQVSGLLARITTALRGVLDSIRQGVAALPLDEIGSAVQTVLGPVTQALGAVRDLVAGIQAALGTLATSATSALGDAEHIVDTFQTDVQALLQGAADFVDSLHLDQVVGSVADGVNGFADALARAQMKPYFDSAVDVIDTTAGVIEAVPLGLLPDSMKSDLDAAVAPVRAIDVEQVKTEVEGWFQIQDGQFALRQPLEDALADLQQQYDGLMQAVSQADPRQLVDPIDEELAKISDRVTSLLPQLNLQPVQDAIAQVKGALGSFDLRQQLKPVDDAFAAILAAIDAYSPETLIQPLAARITAAREKLLADIGLRDWSAKLEELNTQALALLDRVDPQGLEPLLTAAFAELDALLAQVDRVDLAGTFGDFVAAFVSGAGLRVHPWTLQVVTGWLSGRPGKDELGAHADAIKASLVATRAAVQATDTQALALDLSGRVTSLRAGIARLGDGSPGRVRLDAALDRVQPDPGLATLSANRTRYLQELDAGALQADTLRRHGLSEVQAAVGALQTALSPVSVLRDFFRSLLVQVGIHDTSAGVAGVARQVLAVASPARLAGIFVPLFQAFRGRVVALLNGVLAPLQAAIAQLLSLADAIDLTPLQQGVHDVVEQVKTQLQTLSPQTLLGPTLDAFDALRAELQSFDPLADIRALLDALQTTATRVLAKLDASALLAGPIRIYDDIAGALRALSLDTLLKPVLDQLDALAGQVATGLDDTTHAIERLQAALPAPGASSGGAALAGSVSVGGSLGI